jgi:cytochrome c553
MMVCAIAASIAFGQARDERVDDETRAALSLDAHPERGATSFARHCAGCHGSVAGGDAVRNIPMLAGQRYAYLIRQLANFAGGERDNPTMHGIVARSGLNRPQAWVDIASYLNAVAVPAGPATAAAHRNGRGESIFQGQCASCHGADAGGNSDGFVPSLRRQHVGYLKLQLGKLAGGRRHNVDAELVQFLRDFDRLDIDAVAEYLSRLEGPVQDRKKMRDNGVVVD